MLLEPECYKRNCKHYQGVKWLGQEESTEVHYCTAFPDGIPHEITYFGNPLVFPDGIPSEYHHGDPLHLHPYPGDHGIQYEPAEA